MGRLIKAAEQIFLMGLLVMPLTSFTQTLTYDKRTTREFSTYERTQGGILTDTIEIFGILRNPHYDINTLDETKVYIFKRENDNFNPQLHVWYHFDTKTKQIRGIRYNWGLYNPSFSPATERDKLEMLTKRENEFVEKYKSLKQELSNTFGKPIKSKTNNGKQSFIEEVFWMDSEKIVGLSIRFDRELIEIPGFGLMNDFQIEVMTTFK